MKIGIIGAGSIAQAIARQAVRNKDEVILSNSRGPESLTEIVRALGPGVFAGTTLEAAQQDVVVVAVPWKNLTDALKGLPFWEGRIVIDTTNPLIAPDFRMLDLGGRTSSAIVQEMVPGARLVKVMNTLPAELLAKDPREDGGQRVLFMSGDDLRSKLKVGGILERFGFAVIDLGSIAGSSALQQFPGGPLAALNLTKLNLR